VFAVANQLAIAVLDVPNNIRGQGLAEPEGPELAVRRSVFSQNGKVV
jgi:hypothetical protein